MLLVVNGNYSCNTLVISTSDLSIILAPTDAFVFISSTSICTHIVEQLSEFCSQETTLCCPVACYERNLVGGWGGGEARGLQPQMSTWNLDSPPHPSLQKIVLKDNYMGDK